MAMFSQASGDLCSVENAQDDPLASRAFFPLKVKKKVYEKHKQRTSSQTLVLILNAASPLTCGSA